MDRLVQRHRRRPARHPAAWSCNPASPGHWARTFDGSGVNFAVFSAHARMVDLCLFTTPTA
jgi:pullulanase/glycogen debranching enzyme